MSSTIVLRILMVALIAQGVFSCNNSPDVPTVDVPALSGSDHELPVRKWKIIGPSLPTG